MKHCICYTIPLINYKNTKFCSICNFKKFVLYYGTMKTYKYAKRLYCYNLFQNIPVQDVRLKHYITPSKSILINEVSLVNGIGRDGISHRMINIGDNSLAGLPVAVGIDSLAHAVVCRSIGKQV